MQERDLIKKLKQGDEAAYKVLYRHHYKVLCAFAYTYVNDSFTAESLVSDVIVHVWEKRESIDVNQSLRAYLMKAVKNTCINYLDHCLRNEGMKQSLSAKMEKQQLSYHEQDNYPLCSLLEKELESRIELSLGELSQLTREIFYMSRTEKLKYQEIAQEKGLTTDIVKYHIGIALTKLKGDLKDYLPLLSPFLLFP
jgi:RNA polymerase sigma-70 factor (ECF subfamily)